MTTQSTNPHKSNVHKVLAHTYTVYLVLFLIGVALDFIFKIKVFPDNIMMSLGIIMLIIGSVLIVWAQKIGREFRKFEEVKTEHFRRGPYYYTRIPTQWGLLFLVLGFGLIINAFFVIVTTFISFLLVRFYLMSKHDKILAEKYGEAYLEYKKLMKF